MYRQHAWDQVGLARVPSQWLLPLILVRARSGLCWCSGPRGRQLLGMRRWQRAVSEPRLLSAGRCRSGQRCHRAMGWKSRVVEQATKAQPAPWTQRCWLGAWEGCVAQSSGDLGRKRGGRIRSINGNSKTSFSMKNWKYLLVFLM